MFLNINKMGWWIICYKCNGSGYINKNECNICRYEVAPNIILRGQIYVSDTIYEVTPPSSPR